MQSQGATKVKLKNAAQIDDWAGKAAAKVAVRAQNFKNDATGTQETKVDVLALIGQLEMVAVHEVPIDRVTLLP